jgi:hypothetical protein
MDNDTLTPGSLVRRLSDAGYSPTKVASMLDGRLSYRALYRWQNGESQPQRKTDYTAVLDLAVAIGVITSDEKDRATFSYTHTDTESEGESEIVTETTSGDAADVTGMTDAISAT